MDSPPTGYYAKWATPIIVEKNVTNFIRSAKFVKVFSLESFSLYGSYQTKDFPELLIAYNTLITLKHIHRYVWNPSEVAYLLLKVGLPVVSGLLT